MIGLWIGFILLVLGLLALDLGVLNRKAHKVSIRESLKWTAFWIALALVFNVGIYFLYEYKLFGVGTTLGHPSDGKTAALQFLTGYIIEKSLSLDNIFVIALIFAYFGIPNQYQHRVLFWGILGALVMRGAMILAGAALIERFDWVSYVFGGLLIVAAIKMLLTKQDKLDPSRNPLMRLLRRILPVTDQFDGARFLTLKNGLRAATPLLPALVIVESSDLLFAIDSVPAVFAITHDPFIIYTSNVFAILGLRSLYFALAGMLERFRYLKLSVVLILAFVGVKMLLDHHYPIPTPLSLGIILVILLTGTMASWYRARKQQIPGDEALVHEVNDLAEKAYRQAKRIVVIIIGSTVLLGGLAMVVLPGPAIVVIPIGLSILGTEFVWARRLLNRVRNKIGMGNKTEDC